MYYLNLKPEKSGKGYFVDGHEREDVIQHRKMFIDQFAILETKTAIFYGDLTTAKIIMLASPMNFTLASLRRDCTFRFEDLQRNLPRYLENIPLPFVKRAARHCLRYMDGYRSGLVGPVLDDAMKKFRGHRMIPRENLQLIKDEFENKCKHV